jgi:hypothetical protein
VDGRTQDCLLLTGDLFHADADGRPKGRVTVTSLRAPLTLSQRPAYNQRSDWAITRSIETRGERMGLGQCVEDANGLDFSNRDQTWPETRPMFDARCGFGYEISPRHRRPGALSWCFSSSGPECDACGCVGPITGCYVACVTTEEIEKEGYLADRLSLGRIYHSVNSWNFTAPDAARPGRRLFRCLVAGWRV